MMLCEALTENTNKETIFYLLLPSSSLFTRFLRVEKEGQEGEGKGCSSSLGDMKALTLSFTPISFQSSFHKTSLFTI